MNPIVPPVAKLLAILTAATDAGIILFLASGFVATAAGSLHRARERVLNRVAPYARISAFVVAAVATSGSLFFSEVANFTPCLLCWWQRIFMYPLGLLIGMGIIKNDKNIADYGMGMSAVGATIALYHYYIQTGGNKFIPCETVGYSVDCAKRFSMEFGYITIPMMSLTAFVAIFLLLWTSKRRGK